VVEKSIWWGRESNPSKKQPKRSPERLRRKIARVARLAKEADKGKRHNGWQDDSRSSKDEAGDGTPSWRPHPKFNHRRPADRDRLQNRSRSIRKELDRIEYQGE
jgi:hypothetical protein